MKPHIIVLFISCFILWGGQKPSGFCETASTEKQKTVNISRPTVLDLTTAQKTALTGSPTLAATKARIQQAQALVRQQRASYFPALDASASVSHLRLSDNERDRQTAAARSLDPSARIDNPEDNYTAGLTANWLLFDGFAREYRLKSEKLSKQQSVQAYQDATRLLFTAVATAYHRAQLARENVTIASADEAFNQRQVLEAESRQKAGTGSLSDVLNFKVQMNAARSRIYTSEKEYNGFLIGLAVLMGIEEAKFEPSTRLAELKPETDLEMKLPEEKMMIEEAEKHRPDLKQWELQVRQAKALVNVARSTFYPKVNLAGAMTGNRVNDDDFEQDDFGYYLGLNLTYNLFSGGADRAKVSEAAWRLVEVEKNYDNQVITVASEVNTALTDLHRAQKELQLQRMNTALVEQNRDLSQKEYTAGQGSLVRLNEAQRDLVTAQSRLALALVSLRQAWQNLKSATGQNLNLK